ncbi:MAG: HAD-IC family P-type ATPase, partial [Bacilli bacterium]|nr:HAD-IC family P-type ATPase [Bacilli bacterium]
MKDTYYDKNAKIVVTMLNSSLEGKSLQSVKELQDQFGKNELPQVKKDGVFKILWREIKEPIVLILFVTIIISLFTKEYVDATVIFFIVVVDLILGVVQEIKAVKNAAALQNVLKVQAHVIRNGKEMEIDAKELVVGDIVLLSSGNKISADLRIIEADNLTIDESLLTGESVAITKVSKSVKSKNVVSYENMAYAGTSVVTGRGMAIVVGIGVNTELGKIADVVNNTSVAKSPLSIRMDKFTKQISIAIVFIAIILAVILFSKGTSFQEIFLVVVALAVSAMPEGLPLAQTMALTIGSNRMLKKKVLVKNLNAVESLGSCTVIASDKTGTLTKNEQTAKVIVLPNGEIHEISGIGYNEVGKIEDLNETIINICENGFINNEAYVEKKEDVWEYYGDSIDVAFLFMAMKAGVWSKKDIKILGEIPYESENKYSAVFYQKGNKCYCTVKGSLEKVLEFSKTMYNQNGRKVKIKENEVLALNEGLAQNGYRIITLASCEVPKKAKYSSKDLKDLHLDALVGFIDPVRKESKKAVETCKKAGVKVLMITGDHALTALSIAKTLGIAKKKEEVATKEELDAFVDKTTKEFDQFVQKKKVFARVSSLDKHAIVESLKRQGEFVAVTGDGVNDAPALKTANIGVSMGSGTDVAKDTAQMILMDDNFLSIVEGIREGRNAYDNIRKICYFLLSCGFAEVLFFILAIALDLPMPLVAIQLLWLNVVTDGIQDIALSFEHAGDDVMNMPPRKPDESLFNSSMIKEILVSGVYISSLVLGMWIILLQIVHIDVEVARGYIICLMVFIQNMHVLNCRSESQSIFTYRNKNLFVPVAIISCILLQIVVMEVPIFSLFLQTVSLPIKD